MSKMLKLDIFEDGRFIGQIKVKDRWRGIVAIDESEFKEEIEKKASYAQKREIQYRFCLTYAPRLVATAMSFVGMDGAQIFRQAYLGANR